MSLEAPIGFSMECQVKQVPLIVSVAVCLGFVGLPLACAQSRKPANCAQFPIDPRASDPLRSVDLPPPLGGCHTGMRNGFPVPDPTCTPGATNPTVTVAVLRNPAFRTRCTRQAATSEKDKAVTYKWYAIPHPSNNTRENQTCELDHLLMFT